MAKKKMVKKIVKLKKVLRPRITKKISHKPKGNGLASYSQSHKPKVKKEIIAQTPKVVLGSQEIKIVQAKFSASQAVMAVRKTPQMQELPQLYGENKIILLVRDCNWLHTYWEATGDTLNRLKGEIGNAFFSAKRVLRVYDVTDIIFNGRNANHFFDIEVGQDAGTWYINTAHPGRSWCVDFGLLLGDGRFITVVRSNTVTTPIEGPSWITDEEWMIPDEMFARLYGMGFGLGRSSPGKAWQEKMKRELFSGVFASPGMASMASPVKKAAKEKKFWLAVNTELIVYGATEPDAKVTVQGKLMRLRQDGTFTLRFALPDGKQVIPVCATSSDGADAKTITPIVVKETK